MLVEKKGVILFQGDSVTDVDRDRENPTDLGKGYALMAAARLGSLLPEYDLTFYNRGIGGNRLRDLKVRWEKDAIALQPTLVSILIGINDTWHKYADHDPTSVERFEEEYRFILDKTRETLNANILLMEPFVLPIPEDRVEWREDLNTKIEVVRKLAVEYKAHLIPLDGLFAQAATRAPLAYWAPDGVHPTPAGHAIIAEAWLDTVLGNEPLHRGIRA